MSDDIESFVEGRPAHVKEYGATPPDTLAINDPSDSPLQLTEYVLAVTFISVGPTENCSVSVGHPLLLLGFRVYTPE
jgi:hypothetical protein